MPSLVVRLRAFRRFHREAGARFVWAAPVAALGLALVGMTTLSWTTYDVLRPYLYPGAAHERASEFLAALAVLQIASAGWLLHADRRFRGAVGGIVATFASWAIHMASKDVWRHSDLFVPSLIWLAIGVACAMSQAGLSSDDSARVLRQFREAAGSLRAFSQRLFSTQ